MCISENAGETCRSKSFRPYSKRHPVIRQEDQNRASSLTGSPLFLFSLKPNRCSFPLRCRYISTLSAVLRSDNRLAFTLVLKFNRLDIKCFQTRKKETCTKFPPVNSTIENCGWNFDIQFFQSRRQLLVTQPVALHSLLDEAFSEPIPVIVFTPRILIRHLKRLTSPTLFHDIPNNRKHKIESYLTLYIQRTHILLSMPKKRTKSA
jgi:hypothetical protein